MNCPLTAARAYPGQHVPRGNLQTALAQRTPICWVEPVQGQAGAELHVLVLIIYPHIPQVSLQVAVLQSLHVPPDGHAGVVVVIPQTKVPFTAMRV
jgi:hypothetical protein